MDAKSRANFINSVAAGTSVSCPKCGANNKSASKFCISCGADITASQESASKSPVKPAKKTAAPVKAVKYVEPNNVFAQGLPEWSIVPPQVMVRRR